MLFPSAIQSNILVVDQQRDMIKNWSKVEVRKCSDCEFEARTKGGLQTHYLMCGVWIYKKKIVIWTNGLAGKNIQCSDSIQFHFIVKCMHISTERQSTKLIVHEMVSLGQKTQPILYSSHIPCNYNTIRLCDEWSDE